MTFTQSLTGIVFILFVLGSCDTTDEKIPSYLYINKFQVQVKSDEGSAHHNITDGWITINGNYYGAYELPAWIPVLEEGNSEIIIAPGIRLDGRITRPVQYTFLNAHIEQKVLTPGITDTINPITSYQDDLKFSLIEDFNGNHFFSLDNDGDADTRITLSTDSESFEGSNSGLIELNSTHSILKAEHITDLIIPKSGDPIMIELSYKTDIPFAIGFIGYFGAQQERLVSAGIFESAEWSKVYFDFRSLINQSNSQIFHLAVEASYQSTNPLIVQRILIDNIKVIHR